MKNNTPVRFINPYNFIPLNKKGKAKADKTTDESKKFYGKIDYMLTTKTPLFIPNTSSNDAFKMNAGIVQERDKHKNQDFFSYKDLSVLKESTKNDPPEPVIPGSEVRGMFRSNYEILTNSCMSVVDKKAILAARTGTIFQSGLLCKTTNGRYKLYKVQPVYPRSKESSEMMKKMDKELLKNAKDGSLVTKFGRKGYVIKGNFSENNTLKKHPHLLDTRVSENNAFWIDKSIIETMDDAIHEYQKNAEANGQKVYEEYAEAWKKYKDEPNDGKRKFPVYYFTIDAKRRESSTLLSPAQITREIYHAKIKNVLGTYYPCSNPDELCPACSLFGMLNSDEKTNENISSASRVRFTDLKRNKNGNNLEDIYLKPYTIPVLGTPHLSNMPFYLERPGKANYWTYDYKVENGKRMLYSACANGRKFYWHQGKAQFSDNVTADKMNVTIRPLKAGQSFTGTIFLDGISLEELNTLIYLVNCDNEHGYKLGRGKPFGLGSVQTKVLSVECVNPHMDRENSTTVLAKKSISFDSVEGSKIIDSDIISFFKDMTLLNRNESVPFSYPKFKEEGNGYEWFSKNKSVNKKSSYQQYMVSMQPELERITQKKLQNNKSYRNSNRSGGYKSNKYGSNSKGKQNQLLNLTYTKGEVSTVKITSVDDKGVYFENGTRKGRITKSRLNGKNVQVGDEIRVKFGQKVGKKGPDNYDLD